jgi:D-alanyl-D-alanine carboxypeptidase/D-alanyl-D-alanine-endopeptidase (penicillin-binding protein 4)
VAPQREVRVAGVLGALVVPVVVAALVVVLGIAAWGRGDLNRFICDGDCGPSNVIAPKSLTTSTSPGSTALPRSSSGPIDGSRVTSAVAPVLASQVLGPRVGFTAVSPEGTVLATSGGGAFVPASTTKVLVGFAALRSLDPQSTFTTRVVRSEDGIVLVGGGDPYLTTKADKGDRVTRADLTTLARRTASALKRSGDTRVTVDYDTSLFTGPSASPGWESSYVSDDITTRVSALWADQGVTNGVRSHEPAASAARTFASLLEDRGVDVEGEPQRTAAEEDTRTVAEVRSATVAQIVEKLIRVSDNQAAEVMLRHVAIATDQEASFEGGTSAVRSVLEDAGVDTTDLSLSDGSGLSRRNRISPTTLVDTLRAAAGSSRTAGLMVDLPVSGFTGTLVSRFDQLSGALGTVRAKTGTLTGVHSLAGYATDAEGRPVLFAVMADRSDKDQPFAAQAALDRVAAAIATCRCG